MVVCELCARPVGDQSFACTLCAHQAATALNEVAEWLGDALVDAMAKQTVLGEVSGGKPTKKSEQPLPVDLRASEALAVLRSTLSTWARLLQAESATSAPRADTVRSMAAWLAPVMQWARTRTYGAEIIDEVLAAHHQAVRAVDRPGPDAYLGQCPVCGHPIYGPGARIVARCRGEDCQGSVDVAAWREWMWQAKGDTRAGATRMSALLARLGITVGSSTIRMWAKREKLAAAGRDEGGAPLYRLGDVLELAAKAGKHTTAA